jgi:tetratricopeptide (TPR) repeat protein
MAALVWLAVVLFNDARGQAGAEQPDGIKVFMYFGAVVMIAIVIGTILAMSVVPAIGDAIGSCFFNPNQEIEKDPHSGAVARIAQGDYEGAIAEYQHAFEKNPGDTMSLSEIVHLYCDKLHDYPSAEQTLAAVLEREWPPEQWAFFASRLADVYWNYQRDAARARPLLLHIAETMPDTKFAANAVHRIREIDHALEQAGLNPDQAAGADTEPPPAPADTDGEPT